MQIYTIAVNLGGSAVNQTTHKSPGPTAWIIDLFTSKTLKTDNCDTNKPCDQTSTSWSDILNIVIVLTFD